MEMKDLNGKRIRISKNSITAKNENGKTCGVVRNTTTLYDLQANKQMDFYRKLKEHGALPIRLNDVIIKDSEMYIMHNIKSRLFHEKYGYFSEEERIKAEQQEQLYSKLAAAGCNIIECIFIGEFKYEK